MVEYIYYDGIGAKESGKHTVEEFMDIMNKEWNVECSEFLTDSDFKPCRQSKEINIDMLAYKYNMKPLFKKDATKLKKNSKKYKKLLKQCTKYKKNTKKRKCNLQEYIDFAVNDHPRN